MTSLLPRQAVCSSAVKQSALWGTIRELEPVDYGRNSFLFFIGSYATLITVMLELLTHNRGPSWRKPKFK